MEGSPNHNILSKYSWDDRPTELEGVGLARDHASKAANLKRRSRFPPTSPIESPCSLAKARGFFVFLYFWEFSFFAVLYGNNELTVMQANLKFCDSLKSLY